jgi:hypothetical protein
MAEYTGANMYLAWIYAGGTVTLQADERTVNLTPSVDFADASAGADARKQRVTTLKDTMVSFAGVAQTGGTALEDALAEGTHGTVEFGPEGTASGKRKYTIGAFSGGAKFGFKYADVTEITCEFTGDGNYTRTTY